MLRLSLMSSVSQQPGSHIGYSENEIHDQTPSIRNEVLEAYVKFFRGAVGLDFIFMEDNAKLKRAHIVDDFLKEEIIRHINQSSKLPDLNPIEHVCDKLRRAITQYNPPLRVRRQLKAALLEKWVLLLCKFIYTFTKNSRSCNEACIAGRGAHPSYFFRAFFRHK